MEEYTPQEGGRINVEEVKRWFQDNMRIIISVVIVVLIAGGIYSYSKRSEAPVVTTETVDQQQASSEVSGASDKSQTANVSSPKTQVSSAATSKETGSSFIETAGKGDGLTVLARRAAANYLEKNTDSALTKEHKIYIEDFLRKNIGQKGGVHVGTSVEFSKDLIQKAITLSKQLNERQLKNLQKYSARVSSL
jgi:hypothetical protein